MELWNDYEGKLLDGRYRLDRLIGPKGRSAFFTTTDQNGKPATIRVIESLNDEDEILARWNAVRQIKEPALVAILDCNKTVLDGVHLVYAVLEETDADLADLLKERALAPDEAREMAASVVTALEALHARNLVHEHVEAESVLAQGEMVKLRGDCVREAPEGNEGVTLMRRDAHDLAMLVGFALTQRRDVGQTKLPRPFDDFVRNGMSGTWGLKEMGGVVRPVAVNSAPVASVAAASSGPQRVETPVPVVKKMAVPAAGNENRVSAEGLASRPTIASAEVSGHSAQSVAASLGKGPDAGPQVPTRRIASEDRIVLEPEESTRSRSVFWVGLAVAAVLLLSLIWHFTHVSPSPATSSTASAPVSAAPEAAPAAVAPAVVAKPSAAMGGGRSGVVHGAGPVGSQWRVVAYTFNRQDQAQRKAEAIAQAHPALKAEVFTPSGRAPYLVVLGGWMSVQQASALKARARSEGLPHDIYTQNYRGH